MELGLGPTQSSRSPSPPTLSMVLPCLPRQPLSWQDLLAELGWFPLAETVVPVWEGSPGRPGAPADHQNLMDCCSSPSWKELVQVTLPRAAVVPAVSVMTSRAPLRADSRARCQLLTATNLFLSA